MQSLGGVEFFSTLRQDLTDPELLELVDNILDSIFWIHVGEEQLYADRNDATEGTSSAGLSKLLQKPVGKQGIYNHLSIMFLRFLCFHYPFLLKNVVPIIFLRNPDNSNNFYPIDYSLL